MPRVYIPNKSAHDFSKAVRFGELVFCSEGMLGAFNVNHMVRIADRALAFSMPEDYILLCSLPTLNVVICSEFMRKHGRLNLLMWRRNDYVERTIIRERD